MLNYGFTPNLSYRVGFGDPNRVINQYPIGLPFSKGKSYRILHGYNHEYSHNKDHNRYSIDFNLKINDTICAVDDGYAIIVVQDYKYGCSDSCWRDHDRSNYIWIYHPASGLFPNYAHLMYQSPLIQIGDYVRKGQPVARNDMTGYTDTEHLHFDIRKPIANGKFLSVSVVFNNGIRGDRLRRNGYVAQDL